MVRSDFIVVEHYDLARHGHECLDQQDIDMDYIVAQVADNVDEDLDSDYYRLTLS